MDINKTLSTTQVTVDGDIDASQQERYVSLLAKGLGGTLPQVFQANFTRLVGFSNEVYKVSITQPTLRDQMPDLQLQTNSQLEYVLKKKAKQSPHQQFLRNFHHIKEFLAKHRFGPAVIFEDEDILIEEFIPSQTCSAEDFLTLETLLPSIVELARFTQNFRLHSGDFETPHNKSTLLHRVVEAGAVDKATQIVNKLLESPTGPEHFSRPVLQKIQMFLSSEFLSGNLMRDVQELLDLPFVVCHNDFYWLNMLRRTNTLELVLIDYEYAGWNPVGWDLANCLLERNFVYQESSNSMVFKDRMPTISEVNSYTNFYLLELEGKLNVNSMTLGELFDEVKKGSFDRSLEQAAIKLPPNQAYFFRLMLAINSMWILFNILHFDEIPTWPVEEYTLMRIETQDNIRRLLKAATCEYEEKFVHE